MKDALRALHDLYERGIIDAEFRPFGNIAITGRYAVRNGYSNPEALMKIMNLYHQLVNEEADTYFFVKDGDKIIVGDYEVDHFDEFVEDWHKLGGTEITAAVNESYEAMIDRRDYWQAMLVSVQRLGLGVSVNMVLTVLAAYPLSKEARQFPRRTLYVWLMFFTMLSCGGLIPTYMVVRQLGLIDSVRCRSCCCIRSCSDTSSRES